VIEDIEVAGLASYHSTSGDYLFVAHDEAIDVYDKDLVQKYDIALTGIPDLSIEGGLSILQSSTDGYPAGAIAFAFEGEEDSGIAIGSLEGVLTSLGIEENTAYNPRDRPCERCKSAITERCHSQGFALDRHHCSCFADFKGGKCAKRQCANNCSGHGKCVGPGVCECKEGFTGPDCSFVSVQAQYETEANGGDGDDPAVWIHPTKPDQSKIVTTTKSAEGQGFGVFDLQGKLLQHLNAEEPNNVDIIYNFTAGDRKVDLAYAACRGNNTLWYEPLT